MKNRNLLKLNVLALTVAGGLSVVHGATITLVSSGFEQPGTGKISNGFGSVPGWDNAGTAYSDSGVEASGPHGGAYRAYLRGSDDGAYQITSYQVQEGDVFTLTWWANSAGGNGAKNQSVSLILADDQADAYLDTTQAINRANSLGAWTEYTLAYTAQAGDVGKYIGVFFENSSGAATGWAGFDDFSLEVQSIPEPTSLALGGVLVLLGAARRRSRI